MSDPESRLAALIAAAATDTELGRIARLFLDVLNSRAALSADARAEARAVHPSEHVAALIAKWRAEADASDEVVDAGQMTQQVAWHAQGCSFEGRLCADELEAALAVPVCPACGSSDKLNDAYLRPAMLCRDEWHQQPTVAPSDSREPRLTECCEREIDGKTDRYCPKCGWECRIKEMAFVEAMDNPPPPNDKLKALAASDSGEPT
jgi:hypothetical protein